MKRLGKTTHTQRGFQLIEFNDDYGEKCSIQESSNVVPHLWLGVDSVQPKILAREAAHAGIATIQTEGWVNVPLPENALINGRMHLNKKQVRTLIKHLKAWLSTGKLSVR